MPEISDNRGDPNYQDKLQRIASRLREHRGPIYIAAHEDPDGDAIGSVLGLARALAKLGLDARPVAECPRYLSFLPEAGELLPPLERLPEDALLAALDSGDAHRVVGVPVAQPGIPVINIDHHGTNSRYGEIALVEPDKAAAALMIKDLVEALGVGWDPRVATPILTGLVTDTGSFRFSNTTPEVLHAAAELVGHGAALTAINENMMTRPRAYLRLQAEVLATVEYPLGGQMVVAHVNEAMLKRAGAAWEDVESLVSDIRGAEGTQLAALLKDRGAATKVSLRSRGLVSAQNVAIECGGGGHVAAAGATVPLPFLRARSLVLDAARREYQRVGLVVPAEA